MKYPVVLASQSPRRKQLLEWADIPFVVQVSHTDEIVDETLSPAANAQRIAEEKAFAVAAAHAEAIIIAADTIVLCDGKILGKPKDREEAIAILKRLSGKTHSVITGVCIITPEEKHCFADETFVVFKELDNKEINFYIDRYKPYDKAGAYGIQDWIGVTAIEKIDGDFYNVMGLPVRRIYSFLREKNYI